MDLKEYFTLRIDERAKVCEEIAKHSTFAYKEVYGALEHIFKQYETKGFVAPEDVSMKVFAMLTVYNEINSQKL